MSDKPWEFEEERNYGFDADGCERREACHAVVKCPDCGEDVMLVADTECWTEGEDGRWHHEEYGPACGECCENLIVDSWDGCEVYKFPKHKGIQL